MQYQRTNNKNVNITEISKNVWWVMAIYNGNQDTNANHWTTNNIVIAPHLLN